MKKIKRKNDTSSTQMDADIGELVRRHRRCRGILQPDMADYLNIGQSTYCRLEQGKVGWSVSRFVRVCELLRVDSSKLLHEIL